MVGNTRCVSVYGLIIHFISAVRDARGVGVGMTLPTPLALAGPGWSRPASAEVPALGARVANIVVASEELQGTFRKQQHCLLAWAPPRNANT